MQATSDQIIGLTKLQHVDLSIAQLERRLDSLPQKQGIADIRTKRAAIQQKHRALVGARKDVALQIESLREQDASWAEKQQAAQEGIDAAAGDFRAVSARTDELTEAAQQREQLAATIEQLELRLMEYADMEPQVETMLARLETREQELIEQYRREGGALLGDIAGFKDERAALVESVGPELMAIYNRIAKAKQGVALAHLVDGSCNTCRSKIDPSRVLGLRSEYPLSYCPHCGRLMVVDKRYVG